MIRSSSRALIAILSFVALSFVGSAADVPLSEAEVEAIEALRSLRGEDPPAESDVEELLVAGADVHAELCITLIAKRRVPALGEGRDQTLSIQQERILLNALERMDVDRVRPLLDSVLLADDSDSARSAAIRVLGRVGDADDLGRMLERALPDPAVEPSRDLREALRAGLADLLAEEETAEELRFLWRDLPDALRQPCVRALGDARDARTLPLLADLVAAGDELSGLAVAQIRLIGPSLDQGLNERLGEELVACLVHGSGPIAESACLALGELRAEPAIEVLIFHLEDEEPALRRAALWSLQRITGETISALPRLWTVWREHELRRLDTAHDGIRAALTNGNASGILAQLRGASRLRIGRHEMTRALLDAFDHDDAAVRATACRTTAELGSPLAVPNLLGALDDPDSRVAEAALEALRAVTGASSPASPDDWRDWVAPRIDYY